MGDRTPSYDLVVFGATGFVGRILCRYLAKQVGTSGSVKWAIAGRSQDKLKALATELGSADVPCITADATDEASLRSCAPKRGSLFPPLAPTPSTGSPW